MNASYEILLMEYAAGTLDLAQRLIVTAHLNLSPQGRSIVRDCERVGGALMEKRCEPVSMNSNSLVNVLDRIEQKPPEPRQQERHQNIPEDAPLPTCFEEYIMCRPGRRAQWRAVHPGIDVFALPLQCRRSSASMFRFLPGITSPRHRHRGLELTLILDGALMDETGVYEQGALIVTDSDDPVHTPTSCKKRGGICISVTSISMTPADVLARFLSPFRRS